MIILIMKVGTGTLRQNIPCQIGNWFDNGLLTIKNMVIVVYFAHEIRQFILLK